ncbi:MAG: hypothetical protein V8S08_13670 [Lachnoclostridium sp.]
MEEKNRVNSISDEQPLEEVFERLEQVISEMEGEISWKSGSIFIIREWIC